VPIQQFSAKDFRCLASIELDADPEYNLIFGDNASGTTSVLEAIAYLGRGKSFRGAATSNLIRHGEKEFVLFGRVEDGGRESKVGVRNSAGGLEVRVDGQSDGGAAALAAALPLQIIDPNVHDLVAGAPDERRRYLDWIAFHVEHDYLNAWRRFRRALKQRNAALKSGAASKAIQGWNAEFVELAEQLDAGRRMVLEVATDALEEAGEDLLGGPVRFEYRAGWNEERGLLDQLEANIERDTQQGSTQAGPHRADLKLVYDERQARKLVSRGQQRSGRRAGRRLAGAADAAGGGARLPGDRHEPDPQPGDFWSRCGRVSRGTWRPDAAGLSSFRRICRARRRGRKIAPPKTLKFVKK
jgi:DNA replication and repair protein RecF